MDRNKISKGLEFLLIPLFALFAQSCNNNAAPITTTDGVKYYVYMNDEKDDIKVIRDNSSMKNRANAHFYEFIDSARNGYGQADAVRRGFDGPQYDQVLMIGLPNSQDTAEYNQKVFPEIKKTLLK